MAETRGSSSSPHLKTLISLIPMDLYPPRRRSVLLLAAVAVSGYGAYKFYSNRRRISRLLQTLASIAEAVLSSADTIGLVSSDLNQFLRSDSDEIPPSLKQISKILRSDEFVGSISRVSEGLTVGMVRGFGSNDDSTMMKSDFTDRILDKLFSGSGCGFASVVVGSFARNLVIGFYSNGSNQDSSSSWINLICGDEKCRALIANCIEVFVRSAVAVYLEKTMEINTYDEFFAGITNPKHETKVKELLVLVCNGAVETLVKTSHQVLNNSSSGSSSSLKNKVGFDRKENDGSGWVGQVSSTLAVPTNRKFVLDVTGRVTFETVRSFLDFMLLKLYDGVRSSVHAVREGVAERGVEVVRYLSAKSMLVVTICLALCMRVMVGTRVLMPA